ncbi:MAG: hypothetical protein H3C34_16100 [Caldilineaceae bacterium]|nr:hypothetical protein [Caldilineaceae bacterium]
MNQLTSARRQAITLGFWSAFAAAIFAIAFAILAVAFPAAEWSGIEAYARSFDATQMASFVPASFLALAVVVLMVSIHYYAPAEQRILTLLAVVCSAIYATIICTNYYLQLFVVRLNLQAGELESLSVLAMPNFHSLFFALEAIGYLFSSLATLSVAPIFSGGRLANWIRGLFIVNGVIGILGAIIAPFDQPILILASLGFWSLSYPISMILVGLYFRSAKGTLT